MDRVASRLSRLLSRQTKHPEAKLLHVISSTRRFDLGRYWGEIEDLSRDVAFVHHHTRDRASSHSLMSQRPLDATCLGYVARFQSRPSMTPFSPPVGNLMLPTLVFRGERLVNQPSTAASNQTR